MSFISQPLRKSAGHHAAHCMLQIAGVCGDATDAKTAGCVLAHIRYCGNAGGGQKPNDYHGALACTPCHTKFDGNGVKPLPENEWFHYALRGMQWTHDFWREYGFLTFKGEK